MTIDIGDKHTAICFHREDGTSKSLKESKIPDDPYMIYLFSVLEEDINEKMKSIRKHLNRIFKSIGIYTERVIIEK